MAWKLTNAQRTKLKYKKLDVQGKTSLGKAIAQETGKTIRSVAGQYAAAKVAETSERQRTRRSKEKQASIQTQQIVDALKKYNLINDGVPAQDGKTQTGSTTDIGYGG